MKFGCFDHLDASGEPLGTFYENRLKLIEAYDRAGFANFHSAEHHGTPLGMCPSPSVLHSAVAQRTKSIRFGPLVYTLNLYHPLRLADEICMLDHMSGGRFNLGVGRGISPYEVGFYGFDASKGQEMYVEALEVILKAFSVEELSYEGSYYRFSNVPIMLHPLQKPHPPLWYGIGTTGAVVWCAKNRVNVVTNLSAKDTRAITDAYKAEWQKLGHAPQALPLMGATRHVVVAPTDQQALDVARPAYKKWQESYLYLWKRMGGKPRGSTYLHDFDHLLDEGVAIAGSPETVRRGVAEQVESGGLNYMVCRFMFGDMPIDAALRSVELFSREIFPAFR